MGKICVRKLNYLKHLAVLALTFPSLSHGSSIFLGYEFGEMAFNNFQNFAGEIAYQFDNKQSLRLSYINVALSERHLSSNEASVVDGDNIEGLWRAVDIYYDYPIRERVYISPSIGYHDNKYSHTILDESVRNKSATAGVAISYLGDNVFGINALYWRLSATVNYSFNALETTTLGDSTVNGGSFGFYPQVFLGYEFD